MKLKFIENEYWYGGYVRDGLGMPVGPEDCREVDLRCNGSPNQVMPMFVSSKGRFLWKKEGFLISFQNGVMECDDETEVGQGFENLRGAYLALMDRHFPFTGKELSMELFRAPVYNTWIELVFDQNEKDVLRYANGILENGMPAGVLMIDDGWSDYYGRWEFSARKFPNAKETIRKLHEKGFYVMLWLCPFVSPDTFEFRETCRQGLLVKNPDGKPFITEWWNGYSGVLDLSNPKTVDWLKKQLDELQAIGVDGFKFDAGDSIYYDADNVTFGNVTPDEHSLLWAKFGEQYPFNEFRVTSRAGGMSLMQRLCDKDHSWGSKGVASLMPDILQQGITGHPFGCPDMIGGGEYMNFHSVGEGRLDQELFVRHSEIACLMPAMQFSAAPYRVLDKENFEKIMGSIQTREKYKDILLDLIETAKVTGEPVVRYMAYEFPKEPVEKLTDQFMLGKTLLVAPVDKKGVSKKEVYVPKGKWVHKKEEIDSDGRVYAFYSEPGIPVILEKK